MCLGSGWVLVREADMPRDDGAEMAVMWLQAQEGQGCPQKLEETGGPPVESSEGAQPCPHLDLRGGLPN